MPMIREKEWSEPTYLQILQLLMSREKEWSAEQMEQLRAGLDQGYTACQLALKHNWDYSTTKKYAARVRGPDVLKDGRREKVNEWSSASSASTSVDDEAPAAGSAAQPCTLVKTRVSAKKQRNNARAMKCPACDAAMAVGALVWRCSRCSRSTCLRCRTKLTKQNVEVVCGGPSAPRWQPVDPTRPWQPPPGHAQTLRVAWDYSATKKHATRVKKYATRVRMLYRKKDVLKDGRREKVKGWSAEQMEQLRAGLGRGYTATKKHAARVKKYATRVRML